MQVMRGAVVKDVVLVGAGHAHVGVLRMFGMKPVHGVRLTLITREVHTPYSGMLPGLVSGHYAYDEAHIDTGPLARFAGARLYNNAVTGLDLANGQVLCEGRPPVPYDVLSIDIGATPGTGGVPGAGEHAIPVKPIDGFLTRFEALLARVRERKGRARIALVGAGAGGVELILSVERRLRREVKEAGFDESGLSFVLVSGSPDILPTFPAPFRERFTQVLAKRGIAVERAAWVVRVDAEALHCREGPSIAADEILWTTQAAAAPWLRDTGLALDADGFIAVDATLRAEGHANVFAAGDVAAFMPRALPRSGVYAVRSGPVLAGNIRRLLTGRRLSRYVPQEDALYLVSTGDGHAIGTKRGHVFAGRWAWRLKDWIDRRFMARFNRLPDMAAPATARPSPLADTDALSDIAASAMRCGGCGAKVGAGVLTRALGTIVPEPRPDVIVGLDAPDDAALVDTGGARLSVQTVDYFRAIVDDPYLFGKIAANHALGDIFAMAAEPQTALAIATLPYGPEAKVEADLSAMLAGANEVLREAGCALVGGHTGEGAELALGFAVNGLAARDGFVRKGGMQPGDVLILTKPIGTGALLAADMRGKAKGRWVMGAIAQMLVSSRRAVPVLARHGVHAATDVTGFGLIGHLLEMTAASGVAATLVLDAIPVLPGARETAALGIVSSLQPHNLRAGRAVRDAARASRLPLYPLLFDPQTAGGLLASVPAGEAAACLAELKAEGYADAAMIGHVTAIEEASTPISLVESEGGAMSP